MAIQMNGFTVTFNNSTFKAQTLEMPDPQNIRQFRDTYQTDWFTYWRGGIMTGIARHPSPNTTFGNENSVRVEDALQLLANRLNEVLPSKFPNYEAFRRRPFSFLGRKDEIVGLIRGRVQGLPNGLSSFTIRPKFELDSRLIETTDSNTQIGLFLQVETRWDIHTSLTDLEQWGIELRGLYAVRRRTEKGQRRLVGKIDRVQNGTVYFSETYDQLQSMPEAELRLEGSRASFARCLKKMLGPRYHQFEDQRAIEESRLFTGPALQAIIQKMGNVLRDAGAITLAADLECRIGDQIQLENRPGYQTVRSEAPVDYCFDVAKSKRTQYPWPGLERHGPYDRDSFAIRSPRILVICPDTAQGKVEQFVRHFRDGIVALDRSRYASGFARTFGFVNPEFVIRTVPWLNAQSQNAAQIYRSKLEEYLGAEDPNARFDAALVAILDEHAYLPDPINPYLHMKALLLMAGIPVQEARLSTLTQSLKSLQYSLQNIAIAVYAKMGGTPWTVMQDMTVNDELVIGMGTCELSGSRFLERQRHIGITTVFRGDGNYLLSNLSKECSYEEYPEVLKNTMLSILTDLKARNGWRQGDAVRIVFHAYKSLKNIEIDEIVASCIQQVGKDQKVQFAFLTVSHDHPFQLLDHAQQGKPIYGGGMKAVMVPERGLIAQLGRFTRLVCTNGPALLKRENAPLPAPLLVHLHPQSTYRDQAYLSEQVLKFTSLSWRSVLPAHQPVTIFYSSLIAGLLARLRAVPDWSPATLNVNLRHSRWFL